MSLHKYLIVFFSSFIIQTVQAGGFFEVGQVTLTTTIDDVTALPADRWTTIIPTKSFVNPVVIAGPITHNNDLSLFPRIDGFQVGMQSPCENLGGAAGAVVCPPAAGWQPETITYIIVEEGAWEFPDETELEAGIHNTSTVRSIGTNNSSTDLITVKRDEFDSIPGVLHSVSSFNDPEFIASTVVGTTGNNSAVTATQFGLSLEGMEAVTTHGAENIAWIAIEPATGTNAGTAYNSGRTLGLAIDRHDDACTSLGHGNSVFVAQHNTMDGGNGAGVRLCAAPDSVHMDEDQVGDDERTGIPERVAWFAYDAGRFGTLDFLTATQTVVDVNGGPTQPGDTLTYTVVITNELNDFIQMDNPADEMTIQLPPNTTLVGGSLTATSGTLSGSGPLVWNGEVDDEQVITLTYQVTIDSVIAVCNTDLDNQATLHMDPNWDGENSINELSDDPSRDDGIDTDMDGVDLDMDGILDIGIADDDPTRIHVDCAQLTLLKVVNNSPGGGTALPAAWTLEANTAGGAAELSGTSGVTSLVNVGDYVLSELNGPSGYTQEGLACDVGTLTGDTITVGLNEDITCTFTNRDLITDLAITKMVSDENPSIGDTVTFTLIVENIGPDNATNITVNDTVLAGFTFVANSMVGGGGVGDTENQTAPGLIWTISSLPAGATNAVTLTYQAVVN